MAQPSKRKPGRPRKHPPPDPNQPKRPPGRPRKHPLPEAPPPPASGPPSPEDTPPPASGPPSPEDTPPPAADPLPYSEAKRPPGRPPKNPGPDYPFKVRPPKFLADASEKYSAKVARQILLSVQKGCHLETAAASVGIEVRTLRRWLKLGGRLKQERRRARLLYRHAKARGDAAGADHYKNEIKKLGTHRHQKYANFLAKYQQAMADWEENVVHALMLHAEGDWKALQYLLENRLPRRWGKKEVKHKHEMSGTVEHTHAPAQPPLTEEDLRALPLEARRQLLQLLRAKRGEESAVVLPALPAPEPVLRTVAELPPEEFPEEPPAP